MERLELFMKVQVATFVGYAVGWFFIPDFVNDTILGWETETFWPRLIGGAFFGVAWAEWLVVQRLRERMDLVWPFAVIPLGFLAAFLWERAAGGYTGSDLFWWVSVAVTAFFGIGLGLLRAQEN